MMFGWIRRAALPALASLALSGCFLQPGKFDSTLDLRKDDSFTFAYKGQIYMLALSKIADMASKAEASSAPFEPKPCEDENLQERKCTAEDLAEQKQAWEADQQKKKQDDTRNAKMLRAMLGGIDPANPAAAKELAGRLRHQAGWRSVNYVGDGLFEVDFSLTSKLSHDFVFPTIERFPMGDAFVTANRRTDGTVRIDAPGFGGQSANPMQGAMAGLLGGAALGEAANAKPGAKADVLPTIPEIDGTFRVLTDGEILANNTDDGPQTAAVGKVLQWHVTRRTQAAPMALLRLAR